MAHYYIDFKQPPPFREMLPGCVGYVSMAGLIVLYGLKTVGDVQRQNHWPAVENIAPKVLEKLRRIPKHEREGDVRHRQKSLPNTPNNHFQKRCASCDEAPSKITRHHIIPREVGTDHRTIALCPDCHVEIHRLPNRHIAKMSAVEQIEFIRNRIGLPTKGSRG